MSRFGSLWINNKEYDLDDIELDDMEEVEGLCPRKITRDGEQIAEPTPFSELNFGSARVMKVMSWIILRRESPELTLEEVGKIKLVAFGEPDEEMPATGPPAEGADEEQQQNHSAPDDSGVLRSVGSIPG